MTSSSTFTPMDLSMNEAILSLGGIESLNGFCPCDATDEQLQAFLDGVGYAPSRPKITVAEARAQFALRQQQTVKVDAESRSLNARRYLSDTDWYIVRQQETGKPVPEEVLAERQEARESIVHPTP